MTNNTLVSFQLTLAVSIYSWLQRRVMPSCNKLGGMLRDCHM